MSSAVDLLMNGAIDLRAGDTFRVGTVYGALLNFRGASAALAEAVSQPPYDAPPRAPVLCIKPRNTLAGNGASITMPHGVAALAMGGTLGVMIGRVTCRPSGSRPPSKSSTRASSNSIARRRRRARCSTPSPILPPTRVWSSAAFRRIRPSMTCGGWARSSKRTKSSRKRVLPPACSIILQPAWRRLPARSRGMGKRSPLGRIEFRFV